MRMVFSAFAIMAIIVGRVLSLDRKTHVTEKLNAGNQRPYSTPLTLRLAWKLRVEAGARFGGFEEGVGLGVVDEMA